MKKALSYLVLFLLIGTTAVAQNFPVQSNLNITPPYSVYLSDYASITSNKLLVTLMLKDVNQSDIQVKLRLTIKGNGIEIRTKADYLPLPLLLQGGAPLLISGTELESYLNPANLDFSGISKSEFTKTGKLPEGVYQFIVEAIEYRRNVAVSNAGMTIGWLVLNDPPRWTLPMANSLLTATYPQNIFFSWMPMSTASPNAAFTTEYEFTIVELWPDNRSPGDAINSSIPLYQVTTSNTSLVYGPAEPELTPGRKYVCRLRAYDTEGRDLFKNKGYSETLVFTFGQSCKPPNIIQHQVLGPEDARVNWTSQPGNTQFVLSYAELNADGTWSNWYHNETLMPVSNIKGLKAEHTYRYQLKAICGTLESEYSDIKQFNTPAPDTTVVECGKDISIPKVDDSAPLPMLKVGDIINVGGFEARVVDVEGPNGTFSGKCVVNVKTFGGVRILSEFENISVNESHQVTAGAINSIKGELNIIGLDEIIKEVVDVFDNTETDPNVGDPYDPGDPVTIVIDGQTVTVSGDTTFTTPDGTEVIVTLSGQPPIVTVNGEPTEVTTDKLDFDNPNTVTGNELASNVTDTSAHAIKLVTFKPIKNQLFGFDQYPEDIPQFWADYKKEKVNKKDYIINWKTSQSFGLPDQVVMEITTNNPDSIKTRLSVESSVVGPLNFSLNPEDSTWVIQLNGQSHENEDRITAFYTQDDGSKIAVGHLDMVSYNKQDVKLVIVPVGDKYGFEKNPNYTELKDSLNAIYKGAITFWDVSIADPLEADYEENGTKGLDTELPDMVAYTKEMRNLRSALKDRSDYNKDAYYLFLVDKSEKGDKNGIMPFRRHFGFIFMDETGMTESEKLKNNKEKLFHTIAHELGHGPFGLEHVWQEKGTTQGATYNLMDYTSRKPNNLLRKYQWYYIHNPKSSWFGGSEEEVSYDDEEVVFKVLEEMRCAYLDNLTTINLEYAKRSDSWYKVKLFGEDHDFALKYAEKSPLKDVPIIIGKTGQKTETYDGKFCFKYQFGGLTIYTTMERFEQYINPTKEKVEAQFNYVLSKLDLRDGINMIAEYRELRSIAACASKHFKAKDRYEIIKSLAKGEIPEEKEDLILDLLSTSEGSAEFNEFMDLLVADWALCLKLYNRMNNIGGNEQNATRFINTMYILWASSKYSNPNLEIYTYNQSESPRGMFYEPKGTFLRTFSLEGYTFNTHESKVRSSYYDVDNEKTSYYYHHFFQPIRLIFPNGEDNVDFPSKDVPLIMLMGIEETSNSTAMLKSLKVTLDVTSLAIGVGGLAKLRQLPKVYKAFRLVVSGIEISSSVISMITDYTNACIGSEEFCKSLKEYLFWAEIGSLGADVLVTRMMKRSAKKALDEVDDEVSSNIKKHLEDISGIISSTKTRKKLKLLNPELVGTGNVIQLKVADEFGNIVGEIKRIPGANGKLSYYFTDYNGANGIVKNTQYDLKCESSILQSLDGILDGVPKGNYLMMDFCIPKQINNNYSGIGEIIFNDIYTKTNNSKGIDGILGIWQEAAEKYKDYMEENQLTLPNIKRQRTLDFRKK